MPEFHLLSRKPQNFIAAILITVNENQYSPARENRGQQQTERQLFIHAVDSSGFEQKHKNDRDKSQCFAAVVFFRRCLNGAGAKTILEGGEMVATGQDDQRGN